MRKFVLLGYPVVYTVLEGHRTTTVRGDVEVRGSIYHPEETQFAGLVTRVHADGKADLVIFPPGREPRMVAGVEEGAAPGCFREIGADNSPVLEEGAPALDGSPAPAAGV